MRDGHGQDPRRPLSALRWTYRTDPDIGICPGGGCRTWPSPVSASRNGPPHLAKLGRPSLGTEADRADSDRIVHHVPSRRGPHEPIDRDGQANTGVATIAETPWAAVIVRPPPHR